METQTNQTTVTDGPFFYAKSKGLNTREANRFAKLFANPNEFRVVVNSGEAGRALDNLLTCAKDFGLDRTNLTRSQIVTAYNKQQKILRGIAAFIEMDMHRVLSAAANAKGDDVVSMRDSVLTNIAESIQ